MPDHNHRPGLLKRFCLPELSRNERGVTAVAVALSLTMMAGAAGIAVDVGAWQSARSHMQAAADQAAFAAATIYKAGQGKSVATGTAQGVAAQMGFTGNAANCTVNTGTKVTVCVNNPPTAGGFASDTSAWEVVITQPQPMWFASLFLSSAPSASARAVAVAGTKPAGACVIALEPANPSAFRVTGTGTLSMPTCDVFVNSTSPTGTLLTGGAGVLAKDIYLTGGYSTSGNSTISTVSTDGLHTNTTPIADPYRYRIMPTASGAMCTTVSVSGGTTSLQPTFSTGSATQTGPTYCSMSVSGGGKLVLTPGVYVIDRGDFTVSGTVTANGGVTVILTSMACASTTTCSDIGKVTVSGSNSIDITAPKTGPTAGIAIWVDKRATSTNAAAFSGGANMNIFGALYVPSQIINYTGGSSTGTSCTQLIGRTITLSGNAYLSHSGCGGTGIEEPQVQTGMVTVAE